MSLKITACAESGRRDYHGLLSEVVNKFSLQGGLNRQRKDDKEHPKPQGKQLKLKGDDGAGHDAHTQE